MNSEEPASQSVKYLSVYYPLGYCFDCDNSIDNFLDVLSDEICAVYQGSVIFKLRGEFYKSTLSEFDNADSMRKAKKYIKSLPVSRLKVSENIMLGVPVR